MDIQTILGTVADGFSVGTITATSILRVILILLVGIFAIRVLMRIVDRMLEHSEALNSLRVYIHSVTKVLLWFVLLIMVADALGVPITSLIALLSVAGLAVSLALQNTLSNLAGGIMLLVTKPFAVNDFVEAGGVSGTVAAVDLSYTTIHTPDKKVIYVPNSELSAAKIINYTALGKRRVDVAVTASYDAPTASVKAAAQEVIDSLPQILRDPAPQVLLTEYQASSIAYSIRVWTKTEDYWDVYFAIQEKLRDAFEKHGVEMTYDHLNVHLVEK